MALLYFDGFDWQDNTAITSAWSVSNLGSNSSMDSTTQQSGRRASSKAIKLCNWIYGNAATLQKTFTMNSGVFGFAILRNNNAESLCSILAPNGVEQLSVRVASGATDQIYVSRNGTTLWQSDTNTFRLPVGAWVYLEFKFVIHNTAGSWELRLNGSTDAAMSQTGVNTAAQGNTGMGSFRYLVVTSNSSVCLDDFYICDLTGATHNDFLGDVRVDALYPTSDGSHSDFTPSTGSTHYNLVDDPVPNLTDYVSSSTVGAMESYGLTDLAFTPTFVYGVQPHLNALKVDSGARSIAPVLKTNSIEYVGTSQALGSTSTAVSTIYSVNPATGLMWTMAELSALEAGVKVTL